MEHNQTDLVAMLAGVMESEPAYVIGREMIRRLARNTGMGDLEAQKALLYAAPGGAEALCACAADDLVRLKEEGRDMEPYLSDSAFVALLREMPVRAALRLYDAERTMGKTAERERAIGAQDLMEKILAHRGLPAPIRSSMPADASTDYGSMSSAEFAAVKKRLAQAAAQRARL